MGSGFGYRPAPGPIPIREQPKRKAAGKAASGEVRFLKSASRGEGKNREAYSTVQVLPELNSFSRLGGFFSCAAFTWPRTASW